MLRNFSYVVEGKLAGMGAPNPLPPAFTDDLIDLAGHGVRSLVCLLERPPHAQTLDMAGFAWLHEPIVDLNPPTPEQIARVVRFVRDQNAAGRAVALHCHAGIGRTGTMLACCLVAEGMDADEAIARVRAARPWSIETSAQEKSVRDYAARLQAPPAPRRSRRK